MDEEVVGSMPLGFLAGFCCALPGLIGILILAKTPETKKGAMIGFVSIFVLNIIIGCVMGILQAAM